MLSEISQLREYMVHQRDAAIKAIEMMDWILVQIEEKNIAEKRVTELRAIAEEQLERLTGSTKVEEQLPAVQREPKFGRFIYKNGEQIRVEDPK